MCVCFLFSSKHDTNCPARTSDALSGFLVAYATLRLLKPFCELDATWTDEPLTHQLERVIDHLHAESVPTATGDNSGKSSFSAPTFTYCFYLLQAVLQNGGASVGGDDWIMVQALNVLEVHTQLRGDTHAKGIDEVRDRLIG